MFIWILIVAFIIAFLVAVGIGANDSANAFGTCYGSKTLTMLQIVIIGSICEFAGAVLLGSEVSKAIGSAVTQVAVFKGAPYVYAHAMLSVLISTGLWLAVATWTKLAVSTSHSVIGAVIGVSLVWGGIDGIKFATALDVFPYTSGLGIICGSWIVAPVLSGLVAALTYLILRPAILRVDLTDEVLRAFEGTEDRGPSPEHDEPPAPRAAQVAPSEAGSSLSPQNAEQQQQQEQQYDAAAVTSTASSPALQINATNHEGEDSDESCMSAFLDRYRVRITFSAVVFIAFFVDIFFILSKGMKSRLGWDAGTAAWVALLISLVPAVLVIIFTPWLLRFAVEKLALSRLDAQEERDSLLSHQREMSRRRRLERKNSRDLALAAFSDDWEHHDDEPGSPSSDTTASPASPADIEFSRLVSPRLAALITNIQNRLRRERAEEAAVAAAAAEEELAARQEGPGEKEDTEPPNPLAGTHHTQPDSPAAAPPLPPLPPASSASAAASAAASTAASVADSEERHGDEAAAPKPPGTPPFVSPALSAGGGPPLDSGASAKSAASAASPLTLSEGINSAAMAMQRSDSDYLVSHNQGSKSVMSESGADAARRRKSKSKRPKLVDASTQIGAQAGLLSLTVEQEQRILDTRSLASPLTRWGSAGSIAGASLASPYFRGKLDESPTQRQRRKEGGFEEALDKQQQSQQEEPEAALFEQFPLVTEGVFTSLQIFSSAAVSLVHGSNDTANAIGALAAIQHIFEYETVPLEGAEVPVWSLALGGAGICVGLALFGSTIMQVMGSDLAKGLSPSRGFVVQFSAALVVAFGSALGLPLSSTHCVAGATIAVGLMSQLPDSDGGVVDWWIVLKLIIGWIASLVITILTSAAIFAQGIYSPGLGDVSSGNATNATV